LGIWVLFSYRRIDARTSAAAVVVGALVDVDAALSIAQSEFHAYASGRISGVAGRARLALESGLQTYAARPRIARIHRALQQSSQHEHRIIAFNFNLTSLNQTYLRRIVRYRLILTLPYPIPYLPRNYAWLYS